MDFFNYQNFSLVSSKTLETAFELGEIFHSSRAANYIFISSKRVAEYVLILNLNGEIVKKLKIEFSDYPIEPEFTTFNDYFESFKISPVLFSPNGLIVSKVVIAPFNFLEKPLILQFPIGEIQTKSTQMNCNLLLMFARLDIVMIRELLGKLISSSLNSYDSWDIFQLIRRTVQKLTSNEQSEDSASSPQSEAYAFISTLLAEWISLLEGSSIPARDFYTKLLDLFK